MVRLKILFLRDLREVGGRKGKRRKLRWQKGNEKRVGESGDYNKEKNSKKIDMNGLRGREKEGRGKKRSDDKRVIKREYKKWG